MLYPTELWAVFRSAFRTRLCKYDCSWDSQLDSQLDYIAVVFPQIACRTAPGAAKPQNLAAMKKGLAARLTLSLMLVGVQGFEPWTPWSQTRCATGLRHTPKECNDTASGYSGQ